MAMFRVCFIIMACFSGYICANEIIHISSDNYPPYHGQDLKYYGAASKVITEAFELEGVKVKYSFLPWPRAIKMAGKGLFDGVFLAERKPEWEEGFYYSSPVVKLTIVFFHLKDYKFNWDSLDDLRGLSIGGTLGYSVPQYLNDNGLNISFNSSDARSLKQLLLKRIDIFPIDILSGWWLADHSMNSYQKSQLTYHPKPIEEKNHYLMLSKKLKKNKRLLNLFNRGLGKLKNSGRYNEIMQDYADGRVSTD